MKSRPTYYVWITIAPYYVPRRSSIPNRVFMGGRQKVPQTHIRFINNRMMERETFKMDIDEAYIQGEEAYIEG